MEDREMPKFEARQRSRAQLLEELASNDVNLVCEALFSAAQHESDWRWSQAQCLDMLKHDSLMVRACALIAIGEIAIFWGEIDVEIVLPELQRHSTDPALAPFAGDTLSDIVLLKTSKLDS